MLFVFYFLLLLLDSLLVMIQYNRHNYEICFNKLYNFTEVTAYKCPFILMEDLFCYLSFITKNYYLWSTLHFLQISHEKVFLAEIADDERRKKIQCFCVCYQIIIASKINIIFLKFSFNFFEFGTVVIFIYDIYNFGHTFLYYITPFNLSNYSTKPSCTALSLLFNSHNSNAESTALICYLFL